MESPAERGGHGPLQHPSTAMARLTSPHHEPAQSSGAAATCQFAAWHVAKPEGMPRGTGGNGIDNGKVAGC